MPGSTLRSIAITVPRTITSASGVLAQLEEPDADICVNALYQLNNVVDQFWAEIADRLDIIETLYEQQTFKAREMAALVISKVYYHLEEYDDAMNYALGAGKLFDLTQKTEYVEKIVTKCIDEYIRIQVEKDQSKTKASESEGESANLLGIWASQLDVHGVEIDQRLLDIVERMFNRCKKDEEWLHGLGIAIECKRLDKINDFLLSSPNLYNMIDYCQKNLRNPGIGSKEFRLQIVKILVKIYKQQGLLSNGAWSKNTDVKPDSQTATLKFITKLLQCYCFSNDVESTADLLLDLLQSNTALDTADKSWNSTKCLLLCYQLAFDIVDNENQQFSRELTTFISAKQDQVVGKKKNEAPADDEDDLYDEKEKLMEGAMAMDVDNSATPSALPDFNEQKAKEFATLLAILSGSKTLELHLEFLFRNNHTDLMVLEKAKKTVDQKNSMLHNAHMYMHALMQCGTSSDIFLRQNLDWMAKATFWAKFSATASLGVVHKGHVKESKNILSTYLPPDAGQWGAPWGQDSSAYSEAGALYAMGLIHGNHYQEGVETYLLEKLRANQASEVLQHGACLGLGLSSVGTHSRKVSEEMKQALYTDSAVVGESAAYGMGLVMCGSASEREIKELLQYAHDTQHEKIIRGCSVALALIMFQQEEKADGLIEQLLLDQDPILRYGGALTIAMAYCGTSSSVAIKKLLHISVSDVSNDVRRAAVTSLGFVMCNVPATVPKMVKLLAESYNPHVRAAAALALGISGAGMALPESDDILRPLLTDSTDFVRQSAYLGMSLIYMQSVTEKATKFRSDISTCIGNKHEDVITRFGALLGQGIIDAGGRNMCASFFSKSGAVRQGAACGFLLFTQMWYWFPLIHTLSLAFTSTAIIGLNKDLKMPKGFSFTSDVSGVKGVKNATFQYPAPEETKKKEEVVKTTAILSTASKAARRAASKKSVNSTNKSEDEKTAQKMDVENDDDDDSNKKDGTTKTEADTAKQADEKELPAVLTLKNPSRVIPIQEKYIKFDLTQQSDSTRYVPLTGNDRQSGFLLLTDRNPDEPEEFVEAVKAISDEDKEPSAPEPFEWRIETDE